MLPAILVGAALAGSIGSNIYDNWNRNKNTERAYGDIADAIEQTNLANQADIDAYKAMVNSTYGQGAASYQQALQDFLNSPVYQNENFSYGKDVNEFLDPAVNQRIAAAQEALNNSAASGHNRFSSSYNDAVMAKEKALSSEAWKEAYDRMMADRQQAMQEYNTNSQNQWNNYNAQNAQKQAAVNAYGADRASYMQGMSDATMAGMNNRTGVLQSQTNAITGLTNAQNQNSGVLSSILGPAAQFAGAYFGAK